MLFYGEGPHEVKYDPTNDLLYFENHLYSRHNYYYLKIGSSPGRRIAVAERIQGPLNILDSYRWLYWHKTDSFNILSSGRKWYGERFNQGDVFDLDFGDMGLVVGSKLQVKLDVMSRSISNTSFNLSVNGSTAGSVKVEAAQASIYGYKGRDATGLFNLPVFQTIDQLAVSIAYEDPGDSNGYLHDLTVNAQRPLKLQNNQLIIRYPSNFSNGDAQFHMQELVEGLKVWSVGDTNDIQELPVSNLGAQQMFTAPTNNLKSLVLFTGDDFPAPTIIGRIQNQDLKGLQVPDLLIVTTPKLLPEARRLGDFRTNQDQLNTLVVTTDQIFNEFSSGKKDVVAIRDFVRYLYKKQPGLQYLLLFGDASYDYKNIHDPNQGTIPAYQSRESLHDIHSYVSDDFFGFLDDSEGIWSEGTSFGTFPDLLDIGVGRLPVNSLTEAKDLVDKIINYQTNTTDAGSWRQRVIMVADDGESNKFQLQSDYITSENEKRWPEYSTHRLYLDNQIKEKQGDSDRSPLIRQALFNAINRGALLVDFIGHGGETAWTNEMIMDEELISSLENPDNLPVFMTATCEFGRFDDWQRASGAEKLLLRPNGGAIALFTTARPMFLNTNFDISKAFHQSFFKRDSLSRSPRLGDVMRETKNNSIAGTVNRNFTLLGDPSMPLSLPSNQVIITKFNGEEISKQLVIGALSKVEIEGEIRQQGALNSGFNGNLDITVYNRQQELSTLGQGSNQAMSYMDWSDLLFQGSTAVTEGKFKLTFLMPEDIPLDSAQGKINLFAYDQNLNQDALGGSFVQLGGSPSVLEDQQAPAIQLYLDHPSFKSGDQVGESPLLVALIEDNQGINLSNVNGNGIKLTIDNKEPFVVSRFFRSDTDQPTKGRLEYQLSGLEPGNHVLRLSVSDVVGNINEAAIEFLVGDDNQLVLTSITPSPNPSTQSYTDFQFSYENAIEEEELGVLLNIYDSKGILVSSMEDVLTDHQLGTYTIRWNHREKNIKAGLYLYRFFLRSIHYQPGRSSGKLLIINP